MGARSPGSSMDHELRMGLLDVPRPALSASPRRTYTSA
jgi:hypothetical protein